MPNLTTAPAEPEQDSPDPLTADLPDFPLDTAA